VLAQNHYELTEDDWESIKDERVYSSEDRGVDYGVEIPEDSSRDEEGKLPKESEVDRS
jgi:hypothetical protein